jgi:MFS transporter, FSR family, fosmidomycin resistance protein
MALPARLSARIRPRPGVISPTRSLWLLSISHAVNHAQAALLPLVYLAVIRDFGVSVPEIAFLTAVGNLCSGFTQLSYSGLTRRFSRRALLGWGNIVFGGFMALMGAATSFLPFSVANVLSKMGASQQHPVGNGLLAEQYPPNRRGFAISAHIAGGNVGTVAVPLIGTWLIAGVGWQWTVVLFGVPAILIGIAMLGLVQESGADRAAAIAGGSVWDALREVLRDRDLVLTYVSSMLGGGARGLGVLNLFVPLYLSLVLGLDDTTVGLMLTVLLLGSVPGPLIAGWLSDRLGRRPLIVGIYLSGAVSLALFVLAGRDPVLLWIALILLSAFNFVESPQLQALLADISRPKIRDASFSLYFTLAFGVGSLWVAVYGAMIGGMGNAQGLPAVFWLMAIAFLAAAVSVLPIHAAQRAAEVHAEELALGEPAGEVAAGERAP